MSYPTYIITESPIGNKYLIQVAVDGSLNPIPFSGQPGTDQNPLYVQADSGRYYRIYVADDLSLNPVAQFDTPVTGYIYSLSNQLILQDPNGNNWSLRIGIDGGYYTSPVTFKILAVNAIQNNIVDVDFSMPPLARNSNDTADVLNTSNWILKDSSNNTIPIAMISVPAFTGLQNNQGIVAGANLQNVKLGLSAFITTSVPLFAGINYTLTASPSLKNINGNIISGNLVWTFQGLYASEVVTYLINLIGNDLSYDFVGNDINATSDGDWDTQTGVEQVKKKILRRLTTKPGGFFHIPNFGIAIPSKTLLLPSKVLKMQKDVKRQILQEPGVTDANVSITSDNNGNLFASGTVSVKTQTFELGVIQL